MDTIYYIFNGRIALWDGEKSGGSFISEPALIETFGKKAVEEIARFGSYVIKK
ncbi:hypothetical protein D3C81_1304250 [compost metagenome]